MKMAAAPTGSRSVAGVVSMKSPASGDDHGMERGTSAAQVSESVAQSCNPHNQPCTDVRTVCVTDRESPETSQ